VHQIFFFKMFHEQFDVLNKAIASCTL